MKDEILEVSSRNLKKANQIINELKINEIWESLDSTCNLVGSVATNLLMYNLDIDFHVYSKDFSIERSFKAISRICENPRIKGATYKNLLDIDDMCLEWHLSYEDNEGIIWVIDIIHIKNESPYAGKIERVTEKVGKVLNDEIRDTILYLKWEREKHKIKIMGIDIYQAVIEGGVKTFEELMKWKSLQKDVAVSLWEPDID